jgi:uncharacterized damage-inducible protein DinB
MSESKRLANQFEKALEGEAWHGPSWREVLQGVTAKDALRRPVSDAHSIGEIVLHVTMWHQAANQRLQGETPQVTPEQDWPVAHFASDQEWFAATQRLFETGKILADAIGAFPEARLQEKRPKLDGTWFELAIGMLQHDLYHAGQVGLLKKAGATVPA